MSNKQNVGYVSKSNMQNVNINEVNSASDIEYSAKRSKKTVSFKRHLIVLYTISSIALILSIYFIGRSYSSDWDYVGILSLLVTVLVGVNIYTIIDAKQFKKETNDTLKNHAKEVEAMIHQMHAQNLFYNMRNPKESIAQIMMAIEISAKLNSKEALISNVSCLARICNDLNSSMAQYKHIVKFNNDIIEKYCQILMDTNCLQAMNLTTDIRSFK